MTTAILQTEQLIKRFGNLTAVDNLTLQVMEGEIFGFLGPNGAGKTTAISMMCGLLRPDAGRVLIRGQVLHGNMPTLRARIGVCPQETVLWEKLTALEQLEFVGGLYGLSARLARQRGSTLLDTLGLSARAKQIAGNYSGGMKRRLNLALALIHDPELLILDEPEAGLDPQSRVLVREFIRSLSSQKTVVLTTHNMDEADRLVDRVAIIDHGKLLVVDTPAALKRTVGHGDVLEVDLLEPLPGALVLEKVKSGMQAGSLESLTLVEHTLAMRSPNMIECLPDLLKSLRDSDVQISNLRMRANTLEDIFLALTGRRLRE